MQHVDAIPPDLRAGAFERLLHARFDLPDLLRVVFPSLDDLLCLLLRAACVCVCVCGSSVVGSCKVGLSVAGLLACVLA